MFPLNRPLKYGLDFKPVNLSTDRWSKLSAENYQVWENLFKEEAVTNLSDALLRRSDFLNINKWQQEKLQKISALLPGDDVMREKEVSRFQMEKDNLFTSMTRGN